MLDAPVTELPGVGKARAAALARLEIRTLGDLLVHAQRQYEDWAPSPVAEVREGDVACLQGVIDDLREQRYRGTTGLAVTRAVLTDTTGSIVLIWFRRGRFRPLGSSRLKVGQELVVYGSIRRDKGGLAIHNPAVEHLPLPHGAQLKPVYPLTEGISQTQMRTWVGEALKICWDNLDEYLEVGCSKKLELAGRREAIVGMHRPKTREHAATSRARLVFDEVLCYQIGILSERYRRTRQPGRVHIPDGFLVEKMIKELPFALTDGQKRAMQEMAADMESPQPMQRLLQGDVGSGKTVVAVYGLAKTVEAQYQGAVMAPTEVLARQHFERITTLMGKLGVEVGLLTGSLSAREKADICSRLSEGSCQVVVGTQALLERGVQFADLGLVVVDEEHRFGVQQRQALAQKDNTDLLVMTATPIPRTLALTLYGDLDISIIDELPPGRKPVDTRWISSRDRDKVYAFVRSQVKMGHQVYIVYPLVEGAGATQDSAAKTEARRLQALPAFADLSIGLLHGQMGSREKDSVIEDFVKGHWQILVTTSVIEVGIDVPNATVMVVENAERFGLAQLHQLRGRVGRSAAESFCLLMGEPTTPEARQRLELIRQTQDGFILAEADLKLRGPGEILGVRQSGLPELRLTDLIQDHDILEQAHKVAVQILGEDPHLGHDCHRGLRQELARRGYNSTKHDGGLY
mgnify:CR=1 FL=1